ncbi:BMY1 [Symbiodinium sp. CCMP2592]|nr:BMY1 [Symbiodinium sp. CCMP2592]
MAHEDPDGSEKTSEISASSSRRVCIQETWQQWRPGSYFTICVVNATATALLLPRDLLFTDYEWAKVYDDGGEERWRVTKASFSVSVCPLSEIISFLGLMLASVGAGCAAAFLSKRAQASTHAKWACGYALTNWFQSLLGSLTCLMFQAGEFSDEYFGCKYGILPGSRYGKGFFHTVIQCCRAVLYLIGLFWMQMLLARRLDMLERTSKQKYCSHSFRFLIWVQALGVAVIVVSLGVFSRQYHAMNRGDYYSGGLTAMAAALLTWLCNISASAVVICSLIQCLLMLRRVLPLAESDIAPAPARLTLSRARSFAFLQVTGVSVSLVLTICVVPAAVVSTLVAPMLSEEHAWVNWLAVVVQALDSLGNAVAAVLLSGSHRLSGKDNQPSRPDQASRRMSCRVCQAKPRAQDDTAWSPAWKAKVEELSLRGMTLRSLLRFHQEDLLSIQDWSYVPKAHKTRDVVRRAIIPLTSAEECAYAASTLNRDGARRADIMVTHNWGNCFKDLLAAVIADALEESSFNLTTNLLEEDSDILREILSQSGCLDDVYWICAFAVNQHSSICHNNPYDRDPFSHELHPVCNCSRVNISDPDCKSTVSEINKFDDMMYHLAATGSCRQVIAVDQTLDLFNRAWCVAEIAEAKRLQMNQALKLPSKSTIVQRSHTLENLDVRTMRATMETDKKFILEKIAESKNIEQFNTELRSLIFDPKSGLLASWNAMDSLQQIGEVGRLIRWGLADAGTGKVWQQWEVHE